jgi:two-component system response regulator MtrA
MNAIPLLQEPRDAAVGAIVATTRGRRAARVAIIEDNESLAFGLQRTLEADGYEVYVAGDGRQGATLVREVDPDLILLDVMLPAADGFSVLRTLRNEGVSVPVLILTARGEEADKVHGFRLGADDYVTKPFGLSELLMRIEALIRRSGRPLVEVPRADALGFGDVRINPAANTVTKGGHVVALTPKEFDLLLALVRHPGVVLSRMSLLREVWGHRAEVMTRTVDIHVAELRRKLEDVPAKPRYLVTVWKRGYRFDP